MPRAEDMLEMKVANKRMKSKPNPVIPYSGRKLHQMRSYNLAPKRKRKGLRLQTTRMPPAVMGPM